MSDKKKTYQYKKECFELTSKTLEKWQKVAPIENYRLIKAYSREKEIERAAAAKLKEVKAELVLDLRANKAENGLSEKAIDHVVNQHLEVIRLREVRDKAANQADEYNRVLLLFRDMWGSSETLRQKEVTLLRNE